jgi:hypothetical protein
VSTGNVPGELKILDSKGCAGSIPALGSVFGIYAGAETTWLRAAETRPALPAQNWGNPVEWSETNKAGITALGTIRLAFALSW